MNTMHPRSSKKRRIIMRVMTYTAMTLSVLAIAAVFIFFIQGYRLDTNGQIEQGALVQFNSTPSGSTVKIDGATLGSTTATKSNVLAGTHTFVMQHKGYEQWQKTLDIKAGTLTWLDYARLVPINRTPQSVATYPTLYDSLGTTDGKTMIIQQAAADPTFQIVDLTSDKINTTTITIPTTVYSDAATPGTTHTFTIKQWDSGGRYVLVQHTYGGKKEWIVMDTQNMANTKNITTLLALDISQIVFSGTSGNILYALNGADIRRLDLSAGTISRVLVTGVSNFSLYETDLITYNGIDPSDPTKSVVGFYREGDNDSHVLRTETTVPTTSMVIATTRYFNKDYIAIAHGKTVDITAGSYPSSDSKDNSSLVPFASFSFVTNVDHLSFSPDGDYLLVQSGATLTSYDIEHKIINQYAVNAGPKTTVAPLQWLDAAHTWSDYDGNLIMRDFDGANTIMINHVMTGQGIALTQNEKYLYSLNKTNTGYDLQRVLMILP